MTQSINKTLKLKSRLGNNRPELSKSVGAIVLNGRGHVLLLFQRKNRYWEFPKGKTEAGERELDTLKREIFEETGVTKFLMIRNFRKAMYYDFRHKGKLIRRKVVYFLIKTNQKVKLSKEHTRYTWLPLSRAKEKLKHKNQIKLIEDVITKING